MINFCAMARVQATEIHTQTHNSLIDLISGPVGNLSQSHANHVKKLLNA